MSKLIPIYFIFMGVIWVLIIMSINTYIADKAHERFKKRTLEIVHMLLSNYTK